MFKFTQRQKNLPAQIGKNLLQKASSLKSLRTLLSMLCSLINLVYGVKTVQTVTYKSLTTLYRHVLHLKLVIVFTVVVLDQF